MIFIILFYFVTKLDIFFINKLIKMIRQLFNKAYSFSFNTKLRGKIQ
jgi:hypothetical protein